MRVKRRYQWLTAALLGIGMLAAGCAEERPPLDRVQPNALEKGLYTGEWYYQRTVIDIPSGDGFTFVGSTDFNGLTRVTWEVQENFLYARRRTELIKGADDRDETGFNYQGEVVAAFRILKHFDIVQAYNSATGEKLNIREENAIDRPWNEREYFRVDWSQNLVHNYGLDFETVSVEPVPYYVQDVVDSETGEAHPDAPMFEQDGSYFDVTNKLFARAGMAYIEGYGEVPVCWLRGSEFEECGAGEYTIRHSFKRIDPLHQYEPLVYKGKSTEIFGFFWTDRNTYDDQQGIREQNKERYLNRHNLWLRAFDGAGNVIPFSERDIRPIVYYVNREMPEDLKPMAAKVADQWNDVFVDVVKSVGKDPGEQRVFIACLNNPVEAGDPKECGAAGLSPRIGDIRYSFMAYIPKYMKYGLLGLGPSNSDPETGEIISGMAYLYHHNNTAAWSVVEQLELLNGNRSEGDYVDGVDLSEWAARVRGEEEAPSRTHGLADASHMIKNLSHGRWSQYWDAERQLPTDADLEAQLGGGFDAWLEPYMGDMYRRGIFNGEVNTNSARLENLKDTYIEDLLVNDEMLMSAGHIPGQPVTDDHFRGASVARGGFAQLALKRAEMREQYAERRNMYLPEMLDDGLMGLARELVNLPSEEVYDTVRESVYTAVFAHEVGHSLGLQHNFGGSDDAINYFGEYWDIRDDGNVANRLVDPLSQNEIDSKIYNYAYSSVMDYAGRLTLDGLGVGRYDRAAILFGYAQKVEVFKDDMGIDRNWLTDWFERDGDLLYFTGNGPSQIHYTTFYNIMGENLHSADNRMLVDIDDLNDGFNLATVGDETYSRVPYIYCSHSRANLGDSCLTRDFGADPAERMKNILDDLNTWYISRNFPRGRVGIDNSNYVSRYYGRIYDRLKNWQNIYGLYAALLPRFFSPDQLEAFYNNALTGWASQTWAVQNAFNYLVQTLLMPNIGDYGGPFQQPDGTNLMISGTASRSLSLGVEDARYYSTSWGDGDRECGYQWYECLHHIGFYLDKIMAIEALTDSSTNFVARATPEDIRQWEISYYSIFSEQLNTINEAIMAKNWDAVAPYEEDGNLAFPNYAGALSRPNASPVDPFATFTVSLYWQVMGQARFPTTFDRTFVEDSKIYVSGTGREPSVAPEDLMAFTDPLTNISYSAIRRNDRSSAATAMIDQANTIRSFSNSCDATQEETETPLDDCGAAGQVPAWFSAQADFELQSYIQLLQVMSDLDPMMSYGNPYNP